MQEKIDDRLSVYEIGYLIASSVPEEKVGAEVENIKKIINDAGSLVIAEEMPRKQPLAYTIRKKTVSGSYDKFDQAYFGWVKFEVASSKVDGIKKSIENIPSVIRMLLITTVKENTYLGKNALSLAEKVSEEVEKVATESETVATIPESEEAPATIEEIDKSIDDMVKEA
jgi:ribosomal protein S6